MKIEVYLLYSNEEMASSYEPMTLSKKRAMQNSIWL